VRLVPLALARPQVKDQHVFTLLDAVGHASAPSFGEHASHCLPVVGAQINTSLALPFDDIDLQHVLAERHWYVSGYKMSFHHPSTNALEPIFHDAPADMTMLRIVVKSSLTRALAGDLLHGIEKSIAFLMEVGEGYAQMHHARKLRSHPSSNVVC
jgi:hypothetical protein